MRTKSALALCACIAFVLLLAVLAGLQALRVVEVHLGTALARNLTESNKQHILTPVTRELALAQRFADSEVTRRWLHNERDPAARALFFAEAEGYRSAFSDHSYFVASGASRGYYFIDTHTAFSDRPRYTLRPNNPDDAWFFSSLRNTRQFNINVDPNPRMNVTKVWFNVMVKDHGRFIGVAGTGLDLTTFLTRILAHREAGATPLIVTRSGAIQAHPDRRLIDYATINDRRENHSTVYHQLSTESSRRAMRDALRRAAADPEAIPVFWGDWKGVRSLVAVSAIPELHWFAVTVVDPKAARVFDRRLWLPAVTVGVVLLIVLVLAILVAIHRIVLAPLFRLTDSARQMAAGNYSVELPPGGNDELGELTRAFGSMARTVRNHTEELDRQVRERTRELVAVNEQMAAANKQIGDSIQYASLIQNAILPNRELSRLLGERYFVLWRPRDVVGGDLYVFRADDRGCLIGVVDCAGHGVPGALMTMIAHTCINVALETRGLCNPAAVLEDVDRRIRAMLDLDRNAPVATHMDAGFAYVDLAAGAVTFSGAKVSLYWCDGEEVGEIRGDRGALGGRRCVDFTNHTVSLDPSATFYLTTDGILDQAGGPKGFSFGNTRFTEMLRRHAGRPFTEQRAAFSEELSSYQGDRPQRDDITVVSFRFAHPCQENLWTTQTSTCCAKPTIRKISTCASTDPSPKP